MEREFSETEPTIGSQLKEECEDPNKRITLQVIIGFALETCASAKLCNSRRRENREKYSSNSTSQ